MASGFNFNEWNVLTPYDFGDRGELDGIRGRQEMLAQSPVNVVNVLARPPIQVPEPQTYILLLSGMIFMVFFGRRRVKEMGYF